MHPNQLTTKPEPPKTKPAEPAAVMSPKNPELNPPKSEEPKAVAQTAQQSAPKRKKGFKKSTTLAMPKGMEKLLESIRDPLRDVESMMAGDTEADTADAQARLQFKKIGF